jgi:flagellar protein FliO/FliZ
MDVIDFIRYFGALALVLGLVGAAGLAMRKFGTGGLPGAKGRRLAIVESIGLGARHRVYLLRCDGVEHLVVIGPQGATTVGEGTPAQKFQLQEVGT